MNKKLFTLSSVGLLILPLIAMADINAGAAPIPNPGIQVEQLINILLNFIWPLFMGFAVLMFLVAGFEFLTAQGDPTKVAAARQAVLWGVVGVAMGVLAFSLPFVVRTTLGLG